MIWEQRFLSGLKVQIPGYFSKSASVTLEIKKKKKKGQVLDMNWLIRRQQIYEALIEFSTQETQV